MAKKREKLGAHYYDIVYREMEDHGECDNRLLRISVNTNQSKEQQAVTLWHERIHAWLYDMGYTIDRHDEQLIDGLAHRLYDFEVNENST